MLLLLRSAPRRIGWNTPGKLLRIDSVQYVWESYPQKWSLKWSMHEFDTGCHVIKQGWTTDRRSERLRSIWIAHDTKALTLLPLISYYCLLSVHASGCGRTWKTVCTVTVIGFGGRAAPRPLTARRLAGRLRRGAQLRLRTRTFLPQNTFPCCAALILKLQVALSLKRLLVRSSQQVFLSME